MPVYLGSNLTTQTGRRRIAKVRQLSDGVGSGWLY
jgi:hypothetical protein